MTFSSFLWWPFEDFHCGLLFFLMRVLLGNPTVMDCLAGLMLSRIDVFAKSSAMQLPEASVSAVPDEGSVTMANVVGGPVSDFLLTISLH